MSERYCKVLCVQWEPALQEKHRHLWKGGLISFECDMHLICSTRYLNMPHIFPHVFGPFSKQDY